MVSTEQKGDDSWLTRNLGPQTLFARVLTGNRQDGAGGGGGFTIRELLKRYPDAYIPSGCPFDAQAFILNTIGSR